MNSEGLRSKGGGPFQQQRRTHPFGLRFPAPASECPQLIRHSIHRSCEADMSIDQILPTTIILNHGGIDNIEAKNYKDADRSLQEIAVMLDSNAHLPVHVIVIFEDAFVWNSNITLSVNDCIVDHILQRAMQSEWEFNAGVRPKWWPAGIESDRMWEVHCREDRHNGRAELARARLDRYDLRPIVRSPLPPRDMPH